MFYLDVPPPIRRMHFGIYSLSGGVIFMPWRVDQVVSVCDLAKEISDTTEYVAVEKWQSSLAILHAPFKPFQILTVRIQ
jgi:hypothetical protein